MFSNFGDEMATGNVNLGSFGTLALGLALLLLGSTNARADVATLERDEWGIAGFLDSGFLRKLARETERQNLVQPKPVGPSTDAGFALASARALPNRAWSMAFSGTLFRDSDQATFSAYLPMKSGKTVRRIAERLTESPEFGSLVSDAQALSLLARGRINAEFTYSTQFGKHSRLDASAVYRLNANTPDGKPDLVFGLYFKAAF
ncbi:MAG: hypothetical protein HYU75_05900 [Betaproteobacteria bacterium]|nr:hypothetical protein [Betaproteobacteria bacterium]